MGCDHHIPFTQTLTSIIRLIIMLLSEVKTKLNITTLNLNTSTDADGKPTVDKKTGKAGQWLRHWDEETRSAISIGLDLYTKLKAGEQITTLGVQTETRTGAKGDYTAHRIVQYKEAEFSL